MQLVLSSHRRSTCSVLQPFKCALDCPSHESEDDARKLERAKRVVASPSSDTFCGLLGGRAFTLVWRKRRGPHSRLFTIVLQPSYRDRYSVPQSPFSSYTNRTQLRCQTNASKTTCRKTCKSEYWPLARHDRCAKRSVWESSMQSRS